jgi:transcriptional regulator with PAS, ATPase and Fis domain
VAHAIHYASNRRPCPFVRLNCAAIPRDLLEAELFGYQPGAFTGAAPRGKPGKFELAHQGSIFLDEIGDLPLEMQPKLLRVIEEKETERLGGTRVYQSDFRLIAATHENLGKLVDEGRFRKDLFYRLHVIPITIPPLRERKEDIPVLVHYFIETFNRDLGTNVRRLTPDVFRCFDRYHWPGNVRELANVLERILYSMDGDTIERQHLPIFLQDAGRQSSKSSLTLLRSIKDEREKETLLDALQLSRYNKNKAAQTLGIHRTALYKKMKKHQIPLHPS